MINLSLGIIIGILLSVLFVMAGRKYYKDEVKVVEPRGKAQIVSMEDPVDKILNDN